MSTIPGGAVRFYINVVDTESFIPLPDVDVELEQFDDALGTFRPFTRGRTGANGELIVNSSMPDFLGTFQFRASWRGNAKYNGDSSPTVKVKVLEQ